MANSWIEGAGRIAVPSFFIFIGLMLTMIHFRRRRNWKQDAAGIAQGRAEAREGASIADSTATQETRADHALNRVLEYLGNLDVEPAGSGRDERRRNAEARLLMDHIQHDLSRRGVSQLERERLVEDLRESMRSREPG